MEINYALNPDDIVAVNRHLVKSMPAGKQLRRSRFLMRFMVVPFFVLVLAGLLLSAGTAEGNKLSSLALITPIIVLLLPFMIFQDRITDWQIRRNARKGPNAKALFEAQRLKLTQEGLLSESQTSSTFFRWYCVEHIGFTPTHAFIYTAPTHALVVPRRAFENEAAFKAFIDTAMRYRESSAGQTSDNPAIEAAKTFRPGETSEHFQSKDIGKPRDGFRE
jgi:hypothetical protein